LKNQYRSCKYVVIVLLFRLDVGKVSNGFAFFEKIFVHRLVPQKIIVVLDRASNILSNAHLSKEIIAKTAKKYEILLFRLCF
jgi:hypothetical protein